MSTLVVGSDFAGCRIEALVGRGGMGVIYRGTDLRLDRAVAIKLIAGERASDATVRHRFEREARLMAAIDHPNVIPIYAAGEEDGKLYLVMRYVAGIDLGALLQAEGRLEPGRAVQITGQVAAALDAAHAAGLVHRDIKPANVLVAGARVYLSDFGITRAVESGTELTDGDQWIGTVDYCSPEQLRGERTDARSDVYSLGCLLHAALTGSPPHHRATPAATILAHLNDPPPLPSLTEGVPASFDEVLARALAKQPAGRYATAGELGRAAGVAVAGAAVAERLSPGPGRTVANGEGPRLNHGALDDEAATVYVARVQPSPRPRSVASTRIDSRPPLPRRRRWPARIPRSVRAIGAAAVAAVVAAVSLPGSSARPSGSLTEADIGGVVHAFAAAYGHRDVHALAAVLAPDVARVSPTGVQHGRERVLAQYAGQFTNRAINSYKVENLHVQAGWVGRASANYTVARGAERPLLGIVAFGVERVHGRPLIGLITTQPVR